ncbi:MAG: hypothetical protein P9M14_16455 [Candidatus Alcyoniella australis]|nr:hypothetical protein [Candidatus Alcyoniella australis]
MALQHNKLYLFGGYDQDLTSVKNNNLEFDIASSTWTWRTNMPFYSSGPFCANVNGKLHVAGGWNSSYISNHAVYDPIADTWDSSPADLPTARGFGLGTSDGETFYVLGSQDDALAYAYDPTVDGWSALPQMLDWRYSPGGGFVAGSLYALGGGGREGNAWKPRDSSEILDLEGTSWNAFDLSPDDPLVAPCSVFAPDQGGMLILIGGINDSTVSNKTQILRLCLAQLSNVSPPAGQNSEDVLLTISGDNFEADDAFFLYNESKGRIDLQGLSIESATTATGTVTAGRSAGVYELIVSSATGERATLANAFQVIGPDDDDDDDDDLDDADDDIDSDGDINSDDDDDGCCG